MSKIRPRQLIFIISVLLTLLAISVELRHPKGQRSWHGRVLGIPYDFRPPTLGRMRSAWWNPRDDRLFVPRVLGIGWDINLHRAVQLVRRRFQDSSSISDVVD